MTTLIEHTLTNLIPRHSGALPADLIALSRSLLAQSKNKASNLKAEEEVARLYACANLACERLKTTLNLPPIEPRPPIPPRQYRKLYAYFDRTLSTSTSTSTSTPKRKRNPGNTSATTTPQSKHTTQPTTPRPQSSTPSKTRAQPLLVRPTRTPTRTPRSTLRYAQPAQNAARIPPWIPPSVRALCRALDAGRATGYVLAGVESVLTMPRPRRWEGGGGGDGDDDGGEGGNGSESESESESESKDESEVMRRSKPKRKRSQQRQLNGQQHKGASSEADEHVVDDGDDDSADPERPTTKPNQPMQGKLPALIAAIYFFVARRLSGQETSAKEYMVQRKRVVTVLNGVRDDEVVKGKVDGKGKGKERIGGGRGGGGREGREEEEEGWKGWEVIRETDVNAWLEEVSQGGWLEMEWLEEVEVEEGEARKGVDAEGESEDDGESAADDEEGHVRSKQRRRSAAREAQRYGLGTMRQAKYDYLSDARREEYEEWKADVLARCDEIDAENAAVEETAAVDNS